MKNKVIREIHEELNQFEHTNNQKHIYAIEKLVSLLKEEDTKTLKKSDSKENNKKERKNLDGLYLAEEKSSSIFDF